MRLVLALTPSAIEFGSVGDATAEYPLLASVGTLRMAARAGYDSGIGVGESPSLAVQLLNVGRVASTIIGTPLRVRADVYDAAGALFYSGVVAQIAAAVDVLELTLES